MKIFKKSLIMFACVIFYANHAAELELLQFDENEMPIDLNGDSLDVIQTVDQLEEKLLQDELGSIDQRLNSVDMTQIDQQEYALIQTEMVMEMMTNAIGNQKFAHSSLNDYYALTCPYCDYLVGFYGKSKSPAQVKEEENCRHKILKHSEAEHLNDLLMKIFHGKSNQVNALPDFQLPIVAEANDVDDDLMNPIDGIINEDLHPEDLIDELMDFDGQVSSADDQASAATDSSYDPSQPQSGFGRSASTQSLGRGATYKHKAKKKKASTHTTAEPIRDDYETQEEFKEAWAAWRSARDVNNAQVRKSRAKPKIEDFEGKEYAFKVALEIWEQKKEDAAEQKKQRAQRNRLKKNR